MRLASKGLSVVACICFLTIAGCGDSDDDTSAGSASSTATGDAAGLQKAKAALAEVEKRPTEIPMSEPIDKDIPNGKNVTFINCGVAACTVIGDALKEGASALGWTVTTIGTDGSPQQVQQAFDSALRKHTDAIVITATPRAIIEKQLAAAEEQGVPVAASSMLEPAQPPILANPGGPPYNAAFGNGAAAWVTTATAGKVNAAAVSLQGIPASESVVGAFTEGMKKYCSDCPVDVLDVPLTSVGKDLSDRVVSYLRSHPDVDTLMLSVPDSTGNGLPAALRAAGLSDRVRLFGAGGGAGTAGYVAAGSVAAYSPADYFNVAYMSLDALARHFAGVPVVHSEPKNWVVTKDTLPSPTEPYPLVADYKEQFLKLWGKAGN